MPLPQKSVIYNARREFFSGLGSAPYKQLVVVSATCHDAETEISRTPARHSSALLLRLDKGITGQES